MSLTPLSKLGGPSRSELDTVRATADAAAVAAELYPLVMHVDTTRSATARQTYMSIPQGGAGQIVRVDYVTDTTPVGDLSFQLRGPGGLITGGGATLTSAGVKVSTSPPEGAAAVSDGAVIYTRVIGDNIADGRASITFTIRKNS